MDVGLMLTNCLHVHDEPLPLADCTRSSVTCVSGVTAASEPWQHQTRSQPPYRLLRIGASYINGSIKSVVDFFSFFCFVFIFLFCCFFFVSVFFFCFFSFFCFVFVFCFFFFFFFFLCYQLGYCCVIRFLPALLLCNYS